jgi:hypothetical protein
MAAELVELMAGLVTSGSWCRARPRRTDRLPDVLDHPGATI